MPGFTSGRYELVGFIVGRGRQMAKASKVAAGDVLVGLPASGSHHRLLLARRILSTRWSSARDPRAMALQEDRGQALGTGPVLSQGVAQSRASRLHRLAPIPRRHHRQPARICPRNPCPDRGGGMARARAIHFLRRRGRSRSEMFTRLNRGLGWCWRERGLPGASAAEHGASVFYRPVQKGARVITTWGAPSGRE